MLKGGNMKKYFGCFNRQSVGIMILFVLVVLAAFPFYAQSAVTHVSTSYGSSRNGDVEFSHTSGTGLNRLLLVGISHINLLGTPSISSVTYGDSSLTLVSSGGGSGYPRVAIYGLINPAPGPLDVNVDFSGIHSGAVVAASTFTCVDQTTPWGTASSNTGAGDSPSVSVSSAVGDLVFDTLASTRDITATGPDQTELWNTERNTVKGAGSYELATGATTTMSWTVPDSFLRSWAIIGVAIKPATLPTPTSITADPTSLCANDIGDLSLTLNGSGQDDDVHWYTGSCGGTPIGTGNPLVISKPSQTTTYYARYENACGNSTCVNTTVTVNPVPTSCEITAPAIVPFSSTGNIASTTPGYANYEWSIYVNDYNNPMPSLITSGQGTSQITFSAPDSFTVLHIGVTVISEEGCKCINDPPISGEGKDVRPDYPVTPVPTVTEWGIILMATILGVLGLVTLRQKRV
jgi:hypothetical protein